MSIRVLIVDDHEVVRQGLQMFLAVDPDLEVVAEASDGQQALQLARQLRPDVVLMDLLMPVMDGVTATAHIRQELPDTEVVALTSVLEDSAVYRAMRAGAIGYLLKDINADALSQAIRSAAAGQVALSPQAARRLLREVEAPANPDPLTERETEVLRQLALGKSNREIAETLVIAEKTARAHVSNILSKLGVSSRTQAALHALRTGLVPLDSPE